MLLKFTSPDMLNTSLVDVATGERAYEIVTVLVPPSPAGTKPSSLSTSSSSASVSSSQSPTPTVASSSPALDKKATSESESEDSSYTETRQTTITDASGKVMSTVTWKGRRPEISIGDNKIGALTDLFGSSTVRFMPKILAIPTRFDTEYVWTATADSLTLFDYDSETIKGTFHQNALRIPGSSKSSKFGTMSPSKFKLSSTSKPNLSRSTSSLSSSSSSISSTEPQLKQAKSTFISTHLPGIGSNYLEFTFHPLAQDMEIILSFLMMEILRRGRFNLTPYTFERPKLWQIKEARDLFLRRLRRNTV